MTNNDFDFNWANLTLYLVQQYSKQLEDTMEKFALGEIKILISTNIVESGLDIQNANTIIIQDVQQFGLAQLYQVLFFLISSNSFWFRYCHSWTAFSIASIVQPIYCWKFSIVVWSCWPFNYWWCISVFLFWKICLPFD